MSIFSQMILSHEMVHYDFSVPLHRPSCLDTATQIAARSTVGKSARAAFSKDESCFNRHTNRTCYPASLPLSAAGHLTATAQSPATCEVWPRAVLASTRITVHTLPPITHFPVPCRTLTASHDPSHSTGTAYSQPCPACRTPCAGGSCRKHGAVVGPMKNGRHSPYAESRCCSDGSSARGSCLRP